MEITTPTWRMCIDQDMKKNTYFFMRKRQSLSKNATRYLADVGRTTTTRYSLGSHAGRFFVRSHSIGACPMILVQLYILVSNMNELFRLLS